ncbi:hypothetical protein QOT17_010360 [Balamuthia mandrillaris]
MKKSKRCMTEEEEEVQAKRDARRKTEEKKRRRVEDAVKERSENSSLLPLELWSLITSYLDARTLLSLSRTCSLFRTLAAAPSVWAPSARLEEIVSFILSPEQELEKKMRFNGFLGLLLQRRQYAQARWLLGTHFKLFQPSFYLQAAEAKPHEKEKSKKKKRAWKVAGVKLERRGERPVGLETLVVWRVHLVDKAEDEASSSTFSLAKGKGTAAEPFLLDEDESKGREEVEAGGEEMSPIVWVEAHLAWRRLMMEWIGPTDKLVWTESSLHATSSYFASVYLIENESKQEHLPAITSNDALPTSSCPFKRLFHVSTPIAMPHVQEGPEPCKQVLRKQVQEALRLIAAESGCQRAHITS